MDPGKKWRLTVYSVILVTTAVTGTIMFQTQVTAVPEPEVQGHVPTYRYNKDFSRRLVEAARERTGHSIIYDGSYRKIGYPNGDVPEHLGVCADDVVRVYRRAGIDLQKKIHEDMMDNFRLYPDNWGLKKPDHNIDHRRVLNLRVFFRRHGLELPATGDHRDYLPGDLVTWTVQGSLPHIGIVSDRNTASGRRLIIHNIGRGPVMEDMLFDYPITGHYRYYGSLSGKAGVQ